MFSKACEYAIRATLYISSKSVNGSKLSIKEIAKEIDSPEPFTAKILQVLSREKIISSIKGPNGGFYLDPKAKPIPLNTIVRAMDGEDVLHTCSLGLKVCSDASPCPIHHEIKRYKDRLRKIMKEKTVQGLTRELANGKTFLKIDKKIAMR
ncbi:MAG TPA: Rrf2 family transcriptional regulator [Cyclobacteriaceae bacterium]|nr:Rrf2 family transcriptional regulator [Cyclobacteriaceae bacterium]MCB9238579.1 Rrf2 family transcriptional regulator [Flammeovirgaceae bacterium]MCB0499771.1 Rrf2 family transcriptional regulator [Cyclobacteriaceae bacterium]MCO5271751.1 Rrf2 family transcriptional regulator [Cyclobacteriaceae bacterium]MCW5902372.1 Rrf2 family transcriptional regulator [Cyclobacteriaceae bacterium]